MPRVEIVQKHNTAARRLYIRGHNGKIYPYLVMNDACLTESRREERVLQLLRLLNPCLEKRKETTKRHLFFTGRRAAPGDTQQCALASLSGLSCEPGDSTEDALSDAKRAGLARKSRPLDRVSAPGEDPHPQPLDSSLQEGRSDKYLGMEVLRLCPLPS